MNTDMQESKKIKIDALIKFVPKNQSPRVYIDLIKNHILGIDSNGNARPEEDLMLFLYVAHRTQLDPLARQIYPVYRWDTRLGREKMVIQTGIDGMRLIAQRTKQYGGQDDVVFEEKDGTPIKASVTVYKIINNQKVETTASARWIEYAQKDRKGSLGPLWVKMPYTMLGKCAEALALRKAFPSELSGIYSDEEIPNHSNPLSDLPSPVKKEVKEIKPEGSEIDIADIRNNLKKE